MTDKLGERRKRQRQSHRDVQTDRDIYMQRYTENRNIDRHRPRE